MAGYRTKKRRSHQQLSKAALPIVLSLTGLLWVLPRSASAQEQVLSWARIDFLRNQVQLVPRNERARRARIADRLNIGDALRTAQESRAELRFNDGSLARIGERATFRFTPNTRNFQLTNGTVLLLIPPNRGRSTIQTPNAVTGIQGSALFVRYIPETNRTIVGALTNNPDGPMVLSNQDGSEQQALYANQIGVLEDDRIIEIFDFDLLAFWQTSNLADGFDYLQGTYPSNSDNLDGVRQEIREAIDAQGTFPNNDNVIENPPEFRRPEPPAEQILPTPSGLQQGTRASTAAELGPANGNAGVNSENPPREANSTRLQEPQSGNENTVSEELLREEATESTSSNLTPETTTTEPATSVSEANEQEIDYGGFAEAYLNGEETPASSNSLEPIEQINSAATAAQETPGPSEEGAAGSTENENASNESLEENEPVTASGSTLSNGGQNTPNQNTTSSRGASALPGSALPATPSPSESRAPANAVTDRGPATSATPATPAMPVGTPQTPQSLPSSSTSPAPSNSAINGPVIPNLEAETFPPASTTAEETIGTLETTVNGNAANTAAEGVQAGTSAIFESLPRELPAPARQNVPAQETIPGSPFSNTVPLSAPQETGEIVTVPIIDELIEPISESGPPLAEELETGDNASLVNDAMDNPMMEEMMGNDPNKTGSNPNNE